MASLVYTKGLEQMASGTFDWVNDTIKVMAVKTGHVPNAETHEDLADVSADRYVGTTDQTLSNKTVTEDDANNRVELGDTVGVTYASLAQDASNLIIGYIIYYDSTVAATSWLIAYDDANDITPDGNNVNYVPNAQGILQFGYTP
jgi:hypothetical protein